MNRLIIEGKEADLIDRPVNINFQINDLGDISTRNSTFSNTIDLPRTSNNEAIFGMLNVVGSGSRTPYKKLRCTYIQDDITLINNGYLQVKEIDESSFKCNIFDGIIDLAERLKGKTLESLEYPEVELTPAKFYSTFTNTSGHIFALAHFDKAYPLEVFNYVNWDLKRQAPSLYVHTLFSNILNSAGFTFEGDIFNDEGYKSEVITLSKGYETVNDPVTHTAESYEEVGNEHYMDLRNFRFTENGGSSDVYVNDTSVISLKNQNLRFDMTFDMQSFFVNITAEVYKNGVKVWDKLLLGGGTQTFTYDTFSAVNGDIYEFKVKADKSSSLETYHYFRARLGLVIKTLTTSDQIDIKSNVGSKISQIDFIKDVMQRYCLLLLVDAENPNHLIFKEMEAHLNDREGANDLTDKFDYIKDINYSSDSYAAENIAKYKYTNDVLEPTHDEALTVDNEHLKASKTLFQSPWVISTKESERDLLDADIPTYDAFLWDGKLESEGKPEEKFVYNNLEIENRLFKLGRLGANAEYFYNNGTTNWSDTLPNPPLLTLDNVGMDYYLFNYYTSFKDLMNNYKEVTVQMNLSTIDLLKMDFNKLVYLKQFQAYFYLQKYTNNGEVTLLQIKNFT